MVGALRFDGRVAIITGGGGALGRSYAMQLANRGTRLVVNDIKIEAAEQVVQQIHKMGGFAVANGDDVSIDGAAHRLLQLTIDSYGRIDIVICNAGSTIDASFHKMNACDWDFIQNVHVKGSYNITRLAWPLMRQQKYGRVIMTSSAVGLYGSWGAANYGAAKMALVGLANTLSIEGAPYGIHVNTICPVAHSKLTESLFPPSVLNALKCEYVAPVVAYLVHETCKESGGIFETGAGHTFRIRLQRSQGIRLARLGTATSLEAIAEHWPIVNDFSKDSTYPTKAPDFFIDLTQQDQLSAQNVSDRFDGFVSKPIIHRLANAVQNHRLQLAPEVNLVSKYTLINDAGRVASFVIDLKNSPNSSIDRYFEMEDSDFASLATRADLGPAVHRMNRL